MKPIGNPEKGKQYFKNSVNDFGKTWDRKTKLALERLYCSEYTLYAIRLKSGLENNLKELIKKENIKHACFHNSRPVFIQKKDKDILILNTYSDETEARLSLETLLEKSNTKYITTTGHAWSFEENNYWYIGNV